MTISGTKFSPLLFGLSLLLSLLISASSNAHINHKDHYSGNDEQRAFKRLSSHQQLQNLLAKIQRYSFRPIQTGPLISNNGNKGLIDIDVALPADLAINYQVCGETNSTPTIRQAVVCSINDGGRGNLDPHNIGWSTQGRELLAIRLGNPNGRRILVITQQHGNEPAGTEAALSITRWLSNGFGSSVQRILQRLDIVILLRANPDGGEPDAQHCSFNPQPGTVISQDCALIRQNVDPQAGGGFTGNSEADFHGIVGRGYDLNRYHHVALDKPIRPVESQAMVATALAFMPEVILDLHGDLQKTDCQLDLSSINPGQILGSLPTVECSTDKRQKDFRLLSPFADAQTGTQQERVAQSLAAKVMKKIDRLFIGSVGRFSQVQLGAGNIGSGATGSYQLIGAVAGGWETVNFSTDLRADVVAIVAGQPQIGVNPGLPEPRLLNRQIWINRIALYHALDTLASFEVTPPTDTGDFCDYPLAQGLRANLPEEYWGINATSNEVLIPIEPSIGVPLYISGNCPDNPL
ncbi:hypothetical protein M0C34_20950 [Agarivorans sp. TSD2052]|uniref:M14 family zinc carboxypeptidase n=1 Tax=Agarivorans sp. TSD2052 TaxID=2937286 RepID=UPI00200FC290|nr:M14 family zinc carboxypeptidase [Agarivorans sp. TSD2052]UPW18650.1 hypothetical protein M0C34_20950 [Agarivorans sp. TSD2052]